MSNCSRTPIFTLRSINFRLFFNIHWASFKIYQSDYIILHTKQNNFEFGVRKESEYVKFGLHVTMATVLRVVAEWLLSMFYFFLLSLFLIWNTTLYLNTYILSNTCNVYMKPRDLHCPIYMLSYWNMEPIVTCDISIYNAWSINYSPTCLKQAAKGNTKIACLRQVLA